MLDHVPLGPLPSLALRRRSRGATFVRRLPRYDAAVRRPAPVPHGRIPGVHRADLASLPGQMPGLPGSAPHVSVHARGLRPRQVCPPRAIPGCAASPSGCEEHVGTPNSPRFRGSILCLHLPLSTLRRRRYRRLRMTRGQCGWLNLHCQGLTPFTTVPACPGADPNATPQPLPEAGARDERSNCLDCQGGLCIFF
jgi:hypothetical protein